MNNDHRDWIHTARANGWGGLLGAALGALEPLGPLGAQLLWAAQPALGLVVRRDTLAALAQALEAPGGLQELRRLLEDDTDEEDPSP